MLISKTPFRISLFGGGTDYPVWFREHGGAVLGTTIDKYCHVAVRQRPPFFNDNYRIVYSQEECVYNVDDIQHPCVREAIKFMGIKEGLEVIHWADLPARKGLGTSSAFAVGLLNALWALQGEYHNSWTLAVTAILLEQEFIGDNVGCQDQWLAAHGGFQHVQFHENNITFQSIDPHDLEKYLMLYDTGSTRIASEIAREQIEQTPRKEKELTRMHQMVSEAVHLLDEKDYRNIGKLLNEAWWFKKRLSSKISTPKIDAIYDSAMEAGALGGKVLGAGGGGFMLFIVQPSKQPDVKEALEGLPLVPFKFTKEGSKIL